MRRVLAAATTALATVACLNPPVVETIEIRFGGSEIEVVSVVRLNRRAYEAGPAAERIDHREREILERTDPGSRRIEALEPTEDEELLHRERGAVVAAERRARIRDASRLQRLFTGSPVTAAYDEDPAGAWRELSLTVPEGGTAGTSEERRALRELEAWASDVARFVRAEHALYEHVVTHPSRAVPCAAAAAGEGGEELTDDERRLVSVVSDAREAVLAALEAPPDREDTLDERIRRIFDPFPTDLSVTVSGRVTERAGFVDGPDGALVVPRVGAWAAFRSIEGRWIAPDLLLEQWREAEQGKIDFETFAPRMRVVSKTAPTDAEVFDAFRQALRSASAFRVRWEPAPATAPPRPEPTAG